MCTHVKVHAQVRSPSRTDGAASVLVGCEFRMTALVTNFGEKKEVDVSLLSLQVTLENKRKMLRVPGKLLRARSQMPKDIA